MCVVGIIEEQVANADVCEGLGYRGVYFLRIRWYNGWDIVLFWYKPNCSRVFLGANIIRMSFFRRGSKAGCPML